VELAHRLHAHQGEDPPLGLELALEGVGQREDRVGGGVAPDEEPEEDGAEDQELQPVPEGQRLAGGAFGGRLGRVVERLRAGRLRHVFDHGCTFRVQESAIVRITDSFSSQHRRWQPTVKL
jgi:hypothetical protein